MINLTNTRIVLGLVFGLILSGSMTSCTTTGSNRSTSGKSLPPSRMNSAAVQQRNQVIAMEPRGDYYIGRRWFTDGTRYWGYIRKPGQPWANSQLFVMNESVRHQPDRVQEVPTDGGLAHGFDHNSEYKLWGSFTGQKIYDPNSDLILPEFRLTRYELINRNPGFLFTLANPINVVDCPLNILPNPNFRSTVALERESFTLNYSTAHDGTI